MLFVPRNLSNGHICKAGFSWYVAGQIALYPNEYGVLFTVSAAINNSLLIDVFIVRVI